MATPLKTNKGKCWTWREKRQRNQRLYAFWLKHPDWSDAELGDKFQLNRERVRVIIKKMSLTPNEG